MTENNAPFGKWRQWFRRVERLALLAVVLGPILQALVVPTQTIADDGITINYDTTNGQAPASGHAWQPEGQPNVLNPLGGNGGLAGAQFSTQTPLTPDEYPMAGDVPGSEARRLLNFTNPVFPEATDPAFRISKYATQTGTPGRFNVTLTVQGAKPADKAPDPLDIVFVIDRSGSMYREIPDSNSLFGPSTTRAADLMKGMDAALQQLGQKNIAGKLQIGMVGFGSPLVDSGYWPNGMQLTGEHAYVPLTQVTATSGADPLGALQNQFDANFGGSNNASTWTQDGLMRGAAMLNADNTPNARKVMVLLTDGRPTFAVSPRDYPADGVDDPSKSPDATRLYATGGFVGNGYDSDGVSPVVQPDAVENYTDDTASAIKAESIYIQSIGIDLTADTQLDAESHLSQWASPKTDGSGIDSQNVDAQELPTTIVNNVSGIIHDFTYPETISDGSINDPLGSQYHYVDGQTPSVTSDGADAISDTQLAQIRSQLKFGDRALTLDHLTLGQGQKLKVTYQVALNTEDPQFQPDHWYPMNGDTTLTPTPLTTPVNFGVPSGKAPATKLTVTKRWQDLDENQRPDTITFNVSRKVGGNLDPKWQATGELTKAQNWQGEFDHLKQNGQSIPLPEYSNDGQPITYQVTGEAQSDALTQGGYQLASIQDNTLTNQQYILNIKKFAAGADLDSQPLTGAKFTLTDTDTHAIQTVDGTKPQPLHPGTYTLQETTPPKGFDLDDKAFTFKLTQDGKFEATDGQALPDLPAQGKATDGVYQHDQNGAKQVTLIKTDKPTVPPTTLKINKINADTKAPLSGADFSADGLNFTKQADGTAFDSDLLTFDHAYTINETTTPDGYVGLNQAVHVTAKADGTIQVALGDQAAKTLSATDGAATNIGENVSAQLTSDGQTSRQVVLTVGNQPKGILPHTGGNDLLKLWLASVAMGLTAVALMLTARWQRRKEGEA
ncbi:SpaA isopeptide-forming pilin-related protein [Lacticaseibacillus sp. N501-2]|uniref:SpaA isopeptide-forming pilin-related protein n=1 Tax=Lacticaseibacillus salsurae TaxID=3367729 RepID=UPI0038B2AC10